MDETCQFGGSLAPWDGGLEAAFSDNLLLDLTQANDPEAHGPDR